MIYSLLVDQTYAAWSPFQQNEDESPRSLADARQGLDDELAALGERIAAEPLAHVDPAKLTGFYFPTVTAMPAEPERVKVRLPRPGKPDPASWGWQSGDGSKPPGIEP